jgi:hypothetical protein
LGRVSLAKVPPQALRLAGDVTAIGDTLHVPITLNQFGVCVASRT